LLLQRRFSSTHTLLAEISSLSAISTERRCDSTCHHGPPPFYSTTFPRSSKKSPKGRRGHRGQTPRYPIFGRRLKRKYAVLCWCRNLPLREPRRKTLFS